MNYFDIYKFLLQYVKDHRQATFQEILNAFGGLDLGLNLRKEIGDRDSIFMLSDTLANLIDDGLVIGKYRTTKPFGENIFVIQRLSTDGFSYLTALRKPNAKEKLIGFAKENGIAPTLQNMSKLAAQLFFD